MAVFVTEHGNTIWFYLKRGKRILHRERDEPAKITSTGDRFYYKHGNLHRDNDLPAVITATGNIFYYKNGFLHREGDLPAIKSTNGEAEYYLNGKRHRIAGPAVYRSDGTILYFENGKEHRLDGPAVLYSNGGYEYYRCGLLHNDTDAAFYNPSARPKEPKHIWLTGGKFHRLNGPAVIKANGDEEWYLLGAKHRTFGPAIESSCPEYWLYGKQLSKEEYDLIFDSNDGINSYVNLYKYLKDNKIIEPKKWRNIKKEIFSRIKHLSNEPKLFRRIKTLLSLAG